MDLINATRMPTGYTLGVEASGRELLVIVTKGTFVLPRAGEAVRLHEQQLPLVTADVFSGDPATSAPVCESDFSPRKPACDVLLVGSAYAPAGRPTASVGVQLQVGPMRKRIEVVGNRHWKTGLRGIHASAPQPFVQQPVSYDVAFGGTDTRSDDPSEHGAYHANPAGRGFHPRVSRQSLDGTPLPNTHEPGCPIESPFGTYRPMAFGPVGRGWAGRRGYAGTYDQRWINDVSPFLPADFDDRYFQAAPADQQISWPSEQLEVVLSNLTPDGLRHFVLPHFEAPVWLFPKHGEREELKAVLATIVLEPDQDRFTMSWRVARPLKRSVFEVAQVLVGRKGHDWWQEREEMARPIPFIAAQETA
jgi:hypothetical protein